MDQPSSSSSDSFYTKSCFFFPSLLGGVPSHPFLLQNEEDENYPILTDSSSALLLGSSLHDQTPPFNSPIPVPDDTANLVPHNSGTQFLPCAWPDADGINIPPDFTAAFSTSDANLLQKRLPLTHNNADSISKGNSHLPPLPVPIVNGLGRLPFFSFNNDKLECDTNMDEEEVIKVFDLEEEPPPVEDYFQGGEDGNQGLDFANKDASNAHSCSVINGDHDRGKKTGKLPAKNLMAERRRRKKLNDRLYMLRSVIPKISKVQTSLLFPPSFHYSTVLSKY